MDNRGFADYLRLLSPLGPILCPSVLYRLPIAWNLRHWLLHLAGGLLAWLITMRQLRRLLLANLLDVANCQFGVLYRVMFSAVGFVGQESKEVLGLVGLLPEAVAESPLPAIQLAVALIVGPHLVLTLVIPRPESWRSIIYFVPPREESVLTNLSNWYKG